MINIVQNFLRDLNYSIRILTKTPAFATVAILSLALGIGANTIVFSVVNAVLLKSLPYNDPSSLVLIWGDSECFEPFQRFPRGVTLQTVKTVTGSNC